MPVEQRTASAQIRSILIGLVTLIFIGTLGYAVFRAATGNTTAANVGSSDGRWNTGSAESKMQLITEDGPILMPDPAGEQNFPIFISHLGDDAETNWYAFEARPLGAPTDCFLEWDGDNREFTSPCEDETYPIDGEGLRNFQAEVTDDGDLIIDLTPGE